MNDIMLTNQNIILIYEFLFIYVYKIMLLTKNHV